MLWLFSAGGQATRPQAQVYSAKDLDQDYTAIKCDSDCDYSVQNLIFNETLFDDLPNSVVRGQYSYLVFVV
jgi:hypothetical protein